LTSYDPFERVILFKDIDN
jgi:hypothetical protein